MVLVAVVLQSIWISIVDLRTHRISHRSLLILALPLIVSRDVSSLGKILISLAIFFMLTIVMRMGGGDLKLLSLLTLTHGEIIDSRSYLCLFLLSVSCSAICMALRQSSLRASVPLAPAILGPFLLCYLDI
jgi:Flp pilus assembly protein protease CpaA